MCNDANLSVVKFVHGAGPSQGLGRRQNVLCGEPKVVPRIYKFPVMGKHHHRMSYISTGVLMLQHMDSEEELQWSRMGQADGNDGALSVVSLCSDLPLITCIYMYI